jgi:DNA adenine methylase
MQYLGGKTRIAKELGPYLAARLEGRVLVEPFCGALNITVTQTGPRIAADANPYLFMLYSALRAGWSPPEVLSEEGWCEIRRHMDVSDPLTAFAGFGCSFGGKWFAGYAGRSGRNYAGEAARSLRRKMIACEEVTFALADYRDWSFGEQHLVYCDPPYAGTTGYGAVGHFDSGAFWARTREWARRGATVFVSEYSAPAGTRCVWEKAVRTDMHGAGRSGRVERLFEVCA